MTSIFAIILIVAIIYILVQMKHLRRSRQLLEKLNLKLSEANRIKNSYIGHYLDATFKLVNQLDNFVLVGQQKLENFNSLLQPNDKFALENKDALNSTLRIFALIRLGITESEQISEILGYSVNTVYNYRVRTRNKAVDPANFEKNIRKIGL